MMPKSICRLLAIAGAVACSLLQTRQSGADARDLFFLQQNVNAFIAKGRFQDALTTADKLISAAREDPGEKSAEFIAALRIKAPIFEKLKLYDDAAQLWQTVISLDEAFYGTEVIELREDVFQLGRTYVLAQRPPDEIVPVFERAGALAEKAYARSPNDLVDVLTRVAQAFSAVIADPDRTERSAKLMHRVILIAEGAFGKASGQAMIAHFELAEIYGDDFRTDEAEREYKAAADIARSNNPKYLPKILYQLAKLYTLSGRNQDSKRAYELAAAAEGDQQSPVLLSNIALNYLQSGRYSEAVEIQSRAIAVQELRSGRTAIALGNLLFNLGTQQMRLGHYREAEQAFRRGLSITSANEGAIDEEEAGYYRYSGGLDDTTDFQMSLASSLIFQNRSAEAIQLLEDAARRRQQAYGPYAVANADAAVKIGDAQSALASGYHALKRNREARAAYSHAVADFERGWAGSQPLLAHTLSGLADVTADDHDSTKALDPARRSVAIYNALVDGAGAQIEITTDGNHTFNIDPYQVFVRAAFASAEANPSTRMALTEEAFVTAQRDARPAVAAALAQLLTRASAGDPALAAAVRHQQDLLAKLQILDKQIANLMGAATAGNQERIPQLRAQKELTERLADTASRELNQRFPRFSALTNPKPANMAETRAQLRPDEALVMFLVGEHESYVWAVTPDASDWQKIKLGRAELAGKVKELRDPLDRWQQNSRGPAAKECTTQIGRSGAGTTKGAGPTCADTAGLFSLKLGYELYASLLSPVEGIVRGKSHLLVVPSGPLTSLPFNALLGDAPSSTAANFSAYRDAPWLIRRHAISILPSVSSLVGLRTLGSATRASKPFVGIGNPNLSGQGQPRRGARMVQNTRGAANYFRGGVANLDVLRNGLPALPDTALELQDISSTLGGSEGDLILGNKASETTVKDLSAKGVLAGYKVVAFATHALVAGEVQGLEEPAIVLTLPPRVSDTDDGLLTASEVSTLSLDADWVILSACNTAAGDAIGADPLSGLARAFFYAGTRALLVSHWPVASDAAARLTTRSIAALKANPTLGRAGALRQAMLELIEKGEPVDAYPAIWAPFFVVGEGNVAH